MSTRHNTILISNLDSLLCAPYNQVARLDNVKLKHRSARDSLQSLLDYECQLALIPIRDFIQLGIFHALPYGIIRHSLPAYLWCYRPHSIDSEALGAIEKMFDVGLNERELLLREAADESRFCRDTLLKRSQHYRYLVTESEKYRLEALISSSKQFPQCSFVGRARQSEAPLLQPIVIAERPTQELLSSGDARINAREAFNLAEEAELEDLILASMQKPFEASSFEIRSHLCFLSETAYARALEQPRLMSADQEELLYEFQERGINALRISGLKQFEAGAILALLEATEVEEMTLDLSDVSSLFAHRFQELKEKGVSHLRFKLGQHEVTSLKAIAQLGFRLSCHIPFPKQGILERDFTKADSLRNLQDEFQCIDSVEFCVPWPKEGQPPLENIIRVLSTYERFLHNLPAPLAVVPDLGSRYLNILSSFGIKRFLEEAYLEEAIGESFEGLWRRKLNAVRREELRAKAS